LHETIALFSGNRFFLETIRYHNQLRRIVEYESFAMDERMQESSEEHVQILQGLVAGDFEWAAAAMTRHLKLASSAIAVFPKEKSPKEKSA
jgi:DNA-binding GntR family transcriptional regulator